MTFYRFNRVKKKLGGLSGLMKWRMGTTYIFIAALTGLVVLMTRGVALAEEPVPVGLRGAADGTGTHFEVTDSDYLNVILDSSEQVTAHIRSNLSKFR
jgi:hypothetical protein